MAPQWFIKVLDLRDVLLSRSAELRWFPDWMQVRLKDWIEGLRYDWNISRQRFYGVPLPVWFCEGCGEVIVPDESLLPVDPLEDTCPTACCPSCGGNRLKPDCDVMDTWMTSSLTPLINSNWAHSPDRPDRPEIYPMTVRVQAFEIIRTWLFYTIVKSHLHTDSFPWQNVMISGWGLNEHGKKISKRDLDQFTDGNGYNRYEPYSVIKKFGADAVRYWAAGGTLGYDLRYNEKDVKTGRKLVLKLWNAARFCDIQLQSYDPVRDAITFTQRSPEDKWLLLELNKVIPVTREAFEKYSYHEAREATDRFFWTVFCDDYLEIIKDRFWTPADYSEEIRASTRATLWEALRAILGLYAPFLPFVTEYLYQQLYRSIETTPSLHITSWPQYYPERSGTVPEMDVLTAILRSVRKLRTEFKISQTRRLSQVTLDVSRAEPRIANTVRSMHTSIRAAVRAVDLQYGPAGTISELEGVQVDILA
jgi:valyl-tRNA synthetase